MIGYCASQQYLNLSGLLEEEGREGHHRPSDFLVHALYQTHRSMC